MLGVHHSAICTADVERSLRFWRDGLGLRQLCQDYVNDLWLPTHFDDGQAARFALDCFRRTVLGELELVDISAINGQPDPGGLV